MRSRLLLLFETFIFRLSANVSVGLSLRVLAFHWLETELGTPLPRRGWVSGVLTVTRPVTLAGTVGVTWDKTCTFGL